MKQEDKELLLKDLCARLPYRVKVEHLLHAPNNPSDLFVIDMDKNLLYCDHKGREEWYKIDFIKPYLRPMSSMSLEEYKEINELVGWSVEINYSCSVKDLRIWINSDEFDPSIWFGTLVEVQDWLNARHFDYRGLIEKGLALEAPEGMYWEE